VRAEPTDNPNQDAIRIGPAPTRDGCRLEATQFLPQSRDRVFGFFSDAFQLETITPPWLQFAVLTPAPICIEAGTIIHYRLRLHGVPIRWQSRISVWEPPRHFMDEQTRGPYRRWRHQHILEAVDGGTLCRDIVDYAVPGGWLIDALVVRGDVLKIFSFRQARLRELFPAFELPQDKAASRSTSDLRLREVSST
jgi:ligand-binding SRPBCC domain-containing protein